jgi:hypothetical protein
MSQDFKKYLRSFRAATLLPQAATLIPCAGYLLKLDPPWFSPLFGSLSPAIAILAIITGYLLQSPLRAHECKPRSLVSCFALIGSALGFLVVYCCLHHLTTMNDGNKNPKHAVQYQIGFGTNGWSLTPEALKITLRQPSITSQDLTLEMTAMSPDRLETVWKSWTISTAGVLLIVALYLTVFLWSLGWSLLLNRLT